MYDIRIKKMKYVYLGNLFYNRTEVFKLYLSVIIIVALPNTAAALRDLKIM